MDPKTWDVINVNKKATCIQSAPKIWQEIPNKAQNLLGLDPNVKKNFSKLNGMRGQSSAPHQMRTFMARNILPSLFPTPPEKVQDWTSMPLQILS
jgi:hypothetical protein